MRARSNDREHPLKKMTMLLLWRTQQIGAPVSLILLALTLTLQVNMYISWRFSNTYIGITITLTFLLALILLAGFLWDRKLRMWHEQNVVTVERNPYNMHKLTPKEIIHIRKLWIPFFSSVGGEMQTLAKHWAAWCEDQMGKDAELKARVNELQSRYFEEEQGNG